MRRLRLPFGPQRACPEGDYCSVVAGLAFVQILAWAILYYGFASFVLPMSRELGWSKTLLMGGFTLALAVWGLVNVPVGAVIDRGHGRWVLCAGALLGALGCLCWSQVRAPWMFYGAMVLLGTAMAMSLYEPAFAVLTKRYPQRYRQAITWLSLVGGLASTLSFPLGAALVHGVGWRAALQLLAAVLALGVAPLSAWLLRGPAPAPVLASPERVPDATLHKALRTPAFWQLGLAFMVLAFIGPGLWAHMLPALQAKGLSEGQALAVLVWIGPAQVLGRLGYALLGRGLPLHRLGLLVTAALPLSLLILTAGASVPVLLLFALVFGLSNGLSTLVRGSLVPAYFGHANIGRIGAALSTLSLAAQAAAPVAIAALLSLLGGYSAVLLLLTALGAMGTAAYARARPPAA